MYYNNYMLTPFIKVMPIDDFVRFKESCPEANDLAKCRPVNIHDEYEARTIDPHPVYVKKDLYVHIPSTDIGHAMVAQLNGTYQRLFIRGTYMWEQALKLIKKNVAYVVMYPGLLLQRNDYTRFGKQLIDLMRNRSLRICFKMQHDVYFELDEAITTFHAMNHLEHITIHHYNTGWTIESLK